MKSACSLKILRCCRVQAYRQTAQFPDFKRDRLGLEASINSLGMIIESFARCLFHLFHTCFSQTLTQ
ncbi:hypothetical protein SAMN05414139_05638 [Burkholderia sp. D7]|nr:hypothetical protein SAMN05414139_05638 [Burkholderia sp. D7]